MNNQHDDSFDVFLREELQKTQLYINDDKFSAQVMEKLPSSKRLKKWQEMLILFLPAIMIAVFVLSQFSVINFVVRGWVWLTLIHTADLLSLLAMLVASITFILAGWWVKQEGLL